MCVFYGTSMKAKRTKNWVVNDRLLRLMRQHIERLCTWGLQMEMGVGVYWGWGEGDSVGPSIRHPNINLQQLMAPP